MTIDLQKWWEFIRDTLNPLSSVLKHLIKGTALAILVKVAAILLWIILPKEYYHYAEIIELYFYLALVGVLCLSTFILFSFTLFAHMWIELRVLFRETKNKISRRLSQLEAASDVIEYTEPPAAMPHQDLVNEQPRPPVIDFGAPENDNPLPRPPRESEGPRR
jgi:hypothetical protein